MRERFKLWWNDNQGTIFMLRYIIYSLILLAIVYLIDVKFSYIHNYIPEIFMMDAGRSGSLLITLSGSLLTISTFTFSTILTVCTYYTSSFTVSYIENFINNTSTMKLLGVYVGGFFYCITRISILLSKLSRLRAHHALLAENDEAEVLYLGNSFEEELHGSFYQIVSNGKLDPSVAKALLEGLKIIYTVSAEEHKEFIKSYAEEIFRNSSECLNSKFDIDMLEKILLSY